ncbi:hypothetical protein BH11VER1_BH11VER1_19930 [soil metagenome]
MKTSYAAILVAAAIAALSNTKAAMVITYAELPDAYTTSLGGTEIFDFNTMALGRSLNVGWSGVGVFDQIYVKNADMYGGATDATHLNGTRYSVQGAGTSVTSSTLSLNTPSSYFGLWWSAGDAKNVLDFYSGETLLAEFTTSNLLSSLPADYRGNPRNRSLDSSEPFAFVNFFGDTNTAWDRIVFRNNGSSGFESDNYTTRAAAWSPSTDGALPGVPVALVAGTKTTAVTAASLAGTTWSEVPGAPAPPMVLIGVFGLAALMRSARSKHSSK